MISFFSHSGTVGWAPVLFVSCLSAFSTIILCVMRLLKEAIPPPEQRLQWWRDMLNHRRAVRHDKRAARREKWKRKDQRNQA
jgi:hypothetical protein